MLNWKDSFIGYKSILINRNGEYESPKVLHMDPDWSYVDFLNAASNRLDLNSSAKRAFNTNGVEIDDCMMIEDDDRLFLSEGEPFLNTKMNLDKNQNDSISDQQSDGKHRDRGSERSRFSMTNVGPYSIGELLGKGGFGEVREGTNQVTGEKVALKFIKKSDIQSVGAVEKAAVEIKCQSILRHQNIIKLEMNLETNKYIVLAFELMRGGDLFKHLCSRGAECSDGTLSEEEARSVFAQVVSGVSYAHNNNIIHRDLKLENILLKENSLDHVKIADFGLSEFYRPGGTLSSTSGTLSFQAPEVLSGTSHAGPPLDVWSLGVILFAMLCGRLPFEGTKLHISKRPRDAVIKDKIIKCQYKIDDSLSSDAKDIVKRMLCPDPIKRASIPDIIAHRWMRSETYCRRSNTAASSVTVNRERERDGSVSSAVTSSLPSSTSSPILSPLSSNGNRCDNALPASTSNGNDTNSVMSLRSEKQPTGPTSTRLQSAVHDLYSHFSSDGEPLMALPAVSPPVSGAANASSSSPLSLSLALPSLSAYRVSTPPLTGGAITSSDLKGVSEIANNTTTSSTSSSSYNGSASTSRRNSDDVILNDTPQRRRAQSGSQKNKPSNGEITLPFLKDGLIRTPRPSVFIDSALISRLATPGATPGPTPRGSEYRIGLSSASSDMGVGASNSMDTFNCVPSGVQDYPSAKARYHDFQPDRDRDKDRGLRGLAKSGSEEADNHDIGDSRRMSDSSINSSKSNRGLTHTHSSNITDSTDSTVKAVPLFQLVPLRRRIKETVCMGAECVSSRTVETDSEDAVLTPSPTKAPALDTQKSPCVTIRRRSDSVSKSAGRLAPGVPKVKKDTVKSRPRPTPATVDGSSKRPSIESLSSDDRGPPVQSSFQSSSHSHCQSYSLSDDHGSMRSVVQDADQCDRIIAARDPHATVTSGSPLTVGIDNENEKEKEKEMEGELVVEEEGSEGEEEEDKEKDKEENHSSSCPLLLKAKDTRDNYNTIAAVSASSSISTLATSSCSEKCGADYEDQIPDSVTLSRGITPSLPL